MSEQALATVRAQTQADLEAHLLYYWRNLDPAAQYALAALPLLDQAAPESLAATFQALWSNLSPLEQQTLARLSGATLREPDNTTERVVLRDLVQKCLLAWDGRQYRYPSRAWAEFVAAQRVT